MAFNNPLVVSGVNISLLTPQEQEVLYALLKKHRVFLFRITPAQQLEVFDINDEDFVLLQSGINNALGKTAGENDTCCKITSVRSCPAAEQCRYAVVDAPQLGRRLDEMRFARPFSHKVKISVAGCAMCCTEPYLRDIGIIGARRGWSVSFGGNGGAKPRIGTLLAEGLSDKEVLFLVHQALTRYCHKAHRKERTARFIERYGIARFISEISW